MRGAAAGAADVDGSGPIIAVEGLVKRYPERPINAVDGISFEVARGAVFELLSPNGAGKTARIGNPSARARLAGGNVRIAGIDLARDPVAVERRIAVVPQRNNLDRTLTARKNVTSRAAYFGIG